MPRLSQKAADQRQKIITRLRSAVHWAAFQLGGDKEMVTKGNIRRFLQREGIPFSILERWLTPALQMAHEENRLIKAGASRGRGAGWKVNMDWWKENK